MPFSCPQPWALGRDGEMGMEALEVKTSESLDSSGKEEKNSPAESRVGEV